MIDRKKQLILVIDDKFRTAGIKHILTKPFDKTQSRETVRQGTGSRKGLKVLLPGSLKTGILLI